jgi:hypothetical protein
MKLRFYRIYSYDTKHIYRYAISPYGYAYPIIQRKFQTDYLVFDKVIIS